MDGKNASGLTDNPQQHPSVAREVQQKTSIITGGAGFLGSHLAERLLGNGDKVICVDNFFTGRRQNIEHLLHHPNFELIEHDIIQPFENCVDRVDAIYNLACPASPPHYQEDPVRTALICSSGTLNCLRMAAEHGASVFQASTSEVYGDPDVHPQSETYWGNVNPVGPRSCYDEGKRFAETLVTDFSLSRSLVMRIVRIFNTFGPRMQRDDGRVVSNFIVQALSGNDITLFGDGRQTRSFCYVDDLIEGFVRLMSMSGERVGPVNIGNPTEITVLELANIIIDLTGSKSKIVHRPLPIDDPRRRRPDISRAKSLLDWEPRISLEDGLQRTIEYFERDLMRSQPRQERLLA